MAFHATAQVDAKSGVLANHGSPRKRLQLFENFEKAPKLNATLVPTADDPTLAQWAAILSANKSFEILGNNAADADSVPDTGGGVSLSTAGGGTDQIVVLPHQDTNITSWNNADWNGADEVCMEWKIETPAALTDYIIFGGLDTDATVDATYLAGENDDRVLIVFEDGVNSGKWILHYSITDADSVVTDYTADLGVTVVASTHYTLQLTVDANGKVDVYIGIGGGEVEHRHQTANALLTTGTTIDYVPRIGIEEQEASAKNMNLRWIAMSKEYNN
tara:strand:+ start:3150 stop:3974 length:825 start_codon:yes stop_codon:yes gene_type:complete